MAEFQYTPKGPDAPKQTTIGGKTLSANHKYVEITDEALTAKLSNNPSFKLKTKASPKAKAKAKVEKKEELKEESE